MSVVETKLNGSIGKLEGNGYANGNGHMNGNGVANGTKSNGTITNGALKEHIGRYPNN